ncbi:MAG TPA: cytochrome c [Bryobacteraceae bacterium]|nr:cytochrome c [Bryobacteraceae bacterium]
MTWKSIAMFAVAASLTAADNNTAAWNKSHLLIGRDLYRENCAVCHDIDKDKAHSRKLGPSLNHLFKNEKLPLSRAKPNRPYVAVRIKFGGPVMPAFGKKLNEKEINTIIDYIDSK